MLITAGSTDPRFDQPYVDVREWRDTPVRHLYVHGGFTGTDAKFSFSLPPPDQYDGRFYQYTHQLVFSEDVEPSNIGMAAAGGAYFVQTNMGGSEYPRSAEGALSGNYDPSIGGYRVNAAAAKYSRVIAAEVYGRGRVFGYIYGGSGGSYQTITAAECTQGIWDGFLPFVMGTPNSIPNVFLVRVHAMQILKDEWPSILDALEPGGSGDPYAGLNKEQQAALREATKYGFPPRAWFNYLPMGSGPLPLVAGYVPILDPNYVEDFWTKSGYLGTDTRSSTRASRVQADATVVQVIDGPPKQLVLSSVPRADITGADLQITSGDAAGNTVPVGRANGNTVELGYHVVGITIGADPAIVDNIRSGDTVRIDNSSYLALQTYYRHQVPEPGSPFDDPVYDMLRRRNGEAKYPQRERLVGPIGAFNASGQVNTGVFQGKMIVVETLLDGDAVPWQADWYRRKVEAALGKDYEDYYRLWYIDNAQHTRPRSVAQETHAVSYQGVLEQGLRDLSAWAERGVEPPPTTNYKVVNGQVRVPASAAKRRGIQPVVTVRANGATKADVEVGARVELTARIEVPPDSGAVVAADWDFLGNGDYSAAGEIRPSRRGTTVTVTATYTFTAPGTFFPAIRVASQRDSDRDTPYARVQNLGRARVVVGSADDRSAVDTDTKISGVDVSPAIVPGA